MNYRDKLFFIYLQESLYTSSLHNLLHHISFMHSFDQPLGFCLNNVYNSVITYNDICHDFCFYRQGVALQCLGRHGEALAAFSQGLVQDSTSQQLLAGLLEASIKSPLRHNLEPIFQQLEIMKLDQNPFVIVSVVGQVVLKMIRLMF